MLDHPSPPAAHSLFSGPPLEFRPFLDVRGPDAPAGQPTDPSRFLCLPAEVVTGGFVHVQGRTAGRIRFDAAVLSVLAWHWKRSRGRPQSLTYHDGVTVEIGADEFVLSVLSVASIIWVRFRRMVVPPALLEDSDFRRHYEQVRQTGVRLRRTVKNGVPLVTLLGPAREDVQGKASDAYGQRWTMAGSVVDLVIDQLPPCGDPVVLFDDVEPARQGLTVRPYSAVRKAHLGSLQERLLTTSGGLTSSDTAYVQESASGYVIVDVARVLDALTACDFALHGSLTEAAAKTGSLAGLERPVDALAWQRRKAQGRGLGGAYVTTGAWQRGQATAPDRRDWACAVPFLVADIDGQSVGGALSVALLLVRRLVALGARASHIVVAYTGGRGCHVRIPHGLVGRPVYPNVATARTVLTGFFGTLCEGLEYRGTPVIKWVDPSLFSPVHLVRAIGSAHHKHPGHRCVAYCGDEFLHLCGTLEEMVVDVLVGTSRSRQPVPFLLSDPANVASVPALEAMLRASASHAVAAGKPTARSGQALPASRGIIEAVRRGVRPGAEFAPGYVGRAYAALLYAVYLLTHGRRTDPEAWTELQRWNAEENPVPLGQAEGDDDGELGRAFDRARGYVARQDMGRFGGAAPEAP